MWSIRPAEAGKPLGKVGEKEPKWLRIVHSEAFPPALKMVPIDATRHFQDALTRIAAKILCCAVDWSDPKDLAVVNAAT